MDTDLRRKEFPPQNIEPGSNRKIRKDRGQVNWTTGLLLVLFVAVLLMAMVQAERFRAMSLYAEDALAASNLASALVDLEEYGISHRIQIADPETAYGQYLEALRQNLNLNREWQGNSNSIISGPVTVEKYIVYNVDGDRVRICQFTSDGMAVLEDDFGTVRSPNGMLIENTAVYSAISFAVEVVPGTVVRAYKDNLVDVTDKR